MMPNELPNTIQNDPQMWQGTDRRASKKAETMGVWLNLVTLIITIAGLAFGGIAFFNSLTADVRVLQSEVKILTQAVDRIEYHLYGYGNNVNPDGKVK